MTHSKYLLATACAIALVSPLNAQPGNNGNGGGGCGVGQQTNGCGTPAAPVVPPVTNNSGGTGTGTGTGGNATAAQLQGQGQLQGQLQGQGQSIGDTTSTSAALGLGVGLGVARATTGAVTTGAVTTGAVTTGSQASRSDQQQSTANANNSSVSVTGDTFQAQPRNPVATAYAAPLTAGFDTCMGSSTAGAQGIGFGISLGSTWTDANCVRLKNARELAAIGYRTASVQLMCQNADIARAMTAAGTPCAAAQDKVTAP